MSTPATRPVVPTSPPHRSPGRAARHSGAHSVRNRVAIARTDNHEAAFATQRATAMTANVSRRPTPDSGAKDRWGCGMGSQIRNNKFNLAPTDYAHVGAPS